MAGTVDDFPIIRFRACDVGAICGVNRHCDLCQLFIDHVYQGLRKLLLQDASALGLRLVKPQDRLDDLLAKAPQVERDVLRTALKDAADGRRIPHAKDLQRTTAAVQKTLERVVERSTMTPVQAGEVQQAIQHELNTQFGIRNESEAITMYEQETGRVVHDGGGTMLFMPRDLQEALLEDDGPPSKIPRVRDDIDTTDEESDTQRSARYMFMICGLVDGITCETPPTQQDAPPLPTFSLPCDSQRSPDTTSVAGGPPTCGGMVPEKTPSPVDVQPSTPTLTSPQRCGSSTTAQAVTKNEVMDRPRGSGGDQKQGGEGHTEQEAHVERIEPKSVVAPTSIPSTTLPTSALVVPTVTPQQGSASSSHVTSVPALVAPTPINRLVTPSATLLVAPNNNKVQSAPTTPQTTGLDLLQLLKANHNHNTPPQGPLLTISGQPLLMQGAPPTPLCLRPPQPRSATTRPVVEPIIPKEPIVVEVKTRIYGKAMSPVPIYEQVQALVYMKMHRTKRCDLVQYMKNTNSTINITPIHMDAPPLRLDLEWKRSVLPRLYSFATAICVFRSDDHLRYRLLSGTPQEQAELLLQHCPHLPL